MCPLTSDSEPDTYRVMQTLDNRFGVSTEQSLISCGQNQYWSNSNNQGNTAWMWWQIASHYNGNPNVAGYDLINEPVGAPNTTAAWTVYNNLYNSVRSADPNHMIIVEGTFGN